jgi:hypothetical protein
VQITATLHAIKADCGVGVTAVGNICHDILDRAAYHASKSGNSVT